MRGVRGVVGRCMVRPRSAFQLIQEFILDRELQEVGDALNLGMGMTMLVGRGGVNKGRLRGDCSVW